MNRVTSILCIGVLMTVVLLGSTVTAASVALPPLPTSCAGALGDSDINTIAQHILADPDMDLILRTCTDDLGSDSARLVMLRLAAMNSEAASQLSTSPHDSVSDVQSSLPNDSMMSTEPSTAIAPQDEGSNGIADVTPRNPDLSVLPQDVADQLVPKAHASRPVPDAGAVKTDVNTDGSTKITPLEDTSSTPNGRLAPDVTASTTIMRESFEGAFPSGSWRTFDGNGQTNGEYFWKDTSYQDGSYRPHGGSWSAWPAASSLSPAEYYYPNNMVSWMIYGPFDLRGATSAKLKFWYWNKSELNYDYFKWLASANGTNFSGMQNSGNSGGWQYVEFDLANVYSVGSLLGDDSAWIAFQFVSDDSVVDDGPFVDDVELVKESGSASSPCPIVNVPWATSQLRSNSAMTSPWRQVVAPIQNTASNRCSSVYQAVIEQFDVNSSYFVGRYKPTTSSPDTKCNVFAGDVMRAMGAPLPTKGDLGVGASGSQTSDPMTANARNLNEWLNGTRSSTNTSNRGWRSLDATTAQGLVQLRNHVAAGRPALASNSGHISVIRPDQAGVTWWSSLLTAQAGALNFLRDRLSVGFGSSPQPRFFIHD